MRARTNVEDDAYAGNYGRYVGLLHQGCVQRGMRWAARQEHASRTKKILARGGWLRMSLSAKDVPGRHAIPAWLAPPQPGHSPVVRAVRSVVHCARAGARSGLHPRV